MRDFLRVPFPDPPPGDDWYATYDALRDVAADVSGIIASVAPGARDDEGP